MSWNMPDGATTDQYDRYMGYDQPDDEEPEEELMEELRDVLTFEGSQIKEWTNVQVDAETRTLNFTFRSTLTEELAAALHCSFIMDQEGVDSASLGHELIGTELLLPTPGVDGATESFFPESISGFKVASKEGGHTVQAKVVIATRIDELDAAFKALRGAPVDLSVKPRQGELFEGGTRVEMSDGTKKNGSEFPPMETAVLTEAVQVEETATSLPTAAELTGGTPGRKRGRPRKEEITLSEKELAGWNLMQREGKLQEWDMEQALNRLRKMDTTVRTKLLQMIGAKIQETAPDVADETF
jgi:hypothetical protein